MRLDEIEIGARYVIGNYNELSRNEREGRGVMYLPVVEAVALEAPAPGKAREVRCRLAVAPAGVTTWQLGNGHPMYNTRVGDERLIPARRISAPMTEDLAQAITAQKAVEQAVQQQEQAITAVRDRAAALLSEAGLRDNHAWVPGGREARLDRSLPLQFSGTATANTRLGELADGAVDVSLQLDDSTLHALLEALGC